MLEIILIVEAFSFFESMRLKSISLHFPNRSINLIRSVPFSFQSLKDFIRRKKFWSHWGIFLNFFIRKCLCNKESRFFFCVNRWNSSFGGNQFTESLFEIVLSIGFYEQKCLETIFFGFFNNFIDFSSNIGVWKILLVGFLGQMGLLEEQFLQIFGLVFGSSFWILYADWLWCFKESIFDFFFWLNYFFWGKQFYIILQFGRFLKDFFWLNAKNERFCCEQFGSS